MNPWVDRRRDNKNFGQTNAAVSPSVCALEPCPNYPTCPKEERRCLSELTKGGGKLPDNFVLSNGMMAVDFCLHYIMRHHFKRKGGPSKSKEKEKRTDTARKVPILRRP
jgi:hypothetical protein